MFCSNCGKPHENAHGLCDVCFAQANSAPAQEPVQAQQPVQQPVQQYVPVQQPQPEVYAEPIVLNTNGQPPKAKKSMKGLFIALGTVAVAAIAVVVLLVTGVFSGGSKKPVSFDTPEEQFAYVQKESLTKLTNTITGVYGDLSGSASSSNHVEADVHLLLGDAILSLAESATDIDFSWASDVMVSGAFTNDEDLYRVQLGVGLGSTKVATIDAYLDMEEYIMWVGIPELSSTYIEMDLYTLAAMSGVDLDEMMDQAAGSMSSITAVLGALPSEKQLNSILERYIGIAVDAFGEIESETTTVEVDGIEQECTMMTVTITEELLYDVLNAVLEEAADDDELVEVAEQVMDALEPLYGYDMSYMDLGDILPEAIEELQASMEEYEPSDEELVVLVEYIDGSELIGMSIESAGQELYWLTATEGNAFAFEADFAGAATVTGEGTTKNNKTNATYVVEVDGMEVLTLEVKNFDEKKAEKDQISGTFRIIPSEDLMDQMDMSISGDIVLELLMDTSDSSAKIELYLKLDDEEFVGLTLNGKTSKASVKTPGKTVDFTDGEEALMDWVTGMDFKGLSKSLKKAGVPEEYVDYVDQIADMIDEF